MTERETDLLGTRLTDDERELLDLYERACALEARGGNLPPVVTANLRQAMAMLWNACNDLALIDDRPDSD